MDIIVFIILYIGFTFLAFFSEWVERKVKARAQSRVGPLFAGPKGILQPLADFLKLMSKEEINPIGADRRLLNILPVLSATLFMFILFFMPIYNYAGFIDYPADLIFVLGLSAIFGAIVMITGYSNPGPYSNVGAARFGQLFISYEVPFILSIAASAIIANVYTLKEIVLFQAQHYPIIIYAPIGAFVLFISILAKLERVPFDVGEAETEIAAGWQVELSGRRLAFFRLSLDLELVMCVALFVTLYLGGPLGPFAFEPMWLAFVIWFLIKFMVVLVLLSVVEAIFARFRVDQVLRVFWRYITPLALLQVVLSFLVKMYLPI
ncbi:MAG: complex I subunit 1/NuoH family protein [Candidatus Njordarchaeia archaeon]